MSTLNKAAVYVCQKTGCDENTGFTIDKPVRSIERALEVIDDYRKDGKKHPMEIVLIDDYFTTKTIEINSNSLLNAVTITSFGNKRARIIGGRKLEGWVNDQFNGVGCLSCVADFVDGEEFFTDLYVNSNRAKTTRYPDGDGLLTALDVENGKQTGDEWFNLGRGSKWFIAKTEDLEHIDNIEDAIISYYHYWIDEHSPVESYDRQTGKLVMQLKSRFYLTTDYEKVGMPSNLFYYVENIPCAFKNKGEWYLDRNSKKVYYIPLDGETADNIEVIAPAVSKLFVVKGTKDKYVANVRFVGVDLCCTKGDYRSVHYRKNDNGERVAVYTASDEQSVNGGYGAVEFVYCHNCYIDDCSIKNTGIYAVNILEGSRDIRIENTVMDELGAGGVKIFGKNIAKGNTDDYTRNIVVRGCKISNCGKRHAAGCGILANFVIGCEFSENEISYLDYTGISCGWDWGYADSGSYQNIIRDNHIHHVGMGKLSDMGAIYTLGLQAGTLISGNRIHDISSFHYGGWGIYTDEGSSYITVENNIVYRAKCNCYHQHYGSHNLVRNNIFAFAGESTLKVTRNEDHLGLLFANNIFITDKEPVYQEQFDDKYVYPCIESDSNVIWNINENDPVMVIYKGRPVYFDEWIDQTGREVNSVICDPKVDVSDDRFIVGDDSCAYNMGFRPIKNKW